MADEDVAAREKYLKRIAKLEERLAHEVQRLKERKALNDLRTQVEVGLTPEEAVSLKLLDDSTPLTVAQAQAAASALGKIRQALQVP